MYRPFLLLAAFLAAGGTASAQTAAEPAAPRRPALMRQFDSNGDGRVTQDEFLAASRQRFDAADRDRDGALSAAELPAFLRPANARAPSETQRERLDRRAGAMIRRLDSNRDGRLSFDELSVELVRRFHRRDVDGDGVVTAAEVRRAAPRRAERAPAQ